MGDILSRFPPQKKIKTKKIIQTVGTFLTELGATVSFSCQTCKLFHHTVESSARTSFKFWNITAAQNPVMLWIIWTSKTRFRDCVEFCIICIPAILNEGWKAVNRNWKKKMVKLYSSSIRRFSGYEWTCIHCQCWARTCIRFMHKCSLVRDRGTSC